MTTIKKKEKAALKYIVIKKYIIKFDTKTGIKPMAISHDIKIKLNEFIHNDKIWGKIILVTSRWDIDIKNGVIKIPVKSLSEKYTI